MRLLTVTGFFFATCDHCLFVCFLRLTHTHSLKSSVPNAWCQFLNSWTHGHLMLEYVGIVISYCWWQPEIRRSPVEVGSLSHDLQGFIHPNGGCFGFLNHQQYDQLYGAFATETPLFPVDENGKVLRLDSLNTMSLHLKNHIEMYTVVRLFLFHQETFYCFNLQQQQQQKNKPTNNKPTNQLTN